MLLIIDYQNNKDSVYKCDRCKKIIGTLKYKISVKTPSDKNSKKKWDLCEKCYKLLIDLVEK